MTVSERDCRKRESKEITGPPPSLFVRGNQDNLIHPDAAPPSEAGCVSFLVDHQGVLGTTSTDRRSCHSLPAPRSSDIPRPAICFAMFSTG